ncbi:MAG: acyl-CoA dehydrogenase family protein, partial [Pseudomonadota bacterium]|nr:acyl-CoA dehydrogenase family protein [Pseudomonadota bacterium]
DWDRERRMNRPTLEALCALGFGGIYTRPEFGGSGMGRVDAVLVFEQLARGCVSHAAFLSIHNMVAWMIDRFGDDDQRARFVPDLTAGRRIGSYCLTEPYHGSDAANLTTRARQDGADFVLDGAKVFISGAGFSDLYVVMARSEGPGSGAAGISAFVVEADTAGLSFGPNELKMGWNAQPTAMVRFEGCRIPAANRIGGPGQGFRFAMEGLNGGRLNIAACSLGGAQEAFERALRYSREREQFGQAIGDFQNTAFKLADMDTQLDASRLLLFAAARAFDAAGEGSSTDPGLIAHAAKAKRFVTDACFDVANQALQIHGGYGYLADYEIERIVRDLRVHQILEGTNEIMRLIIARALDDRF